MNCIVTAGPTYEPLDNVRRITNFSTGKLGVGLANFLTDHGHEVILFIGEQATYPGERRAAHTRTFSTTVSLREGLMAMRGDSVGAVFHAAAVSDFAFGTVWQRSPEGELTAVKAGKISTREGTLMVELIPTPKLIYELRGWFPKARLIGWKYEVDGQREDVLRTARRQLAKAHTDLCVANGPAYGTGFGLVTAAGERTVGDVQILHAQLERFIQPA